MTASKGAGEPDLDGPASRDPNLLSPHGFAIGSTLAGKYVIREVLGSGGMGLVVLATHTVLRQPVAIKLLRRELASDANHVERFLREALAAAQLKSQHVVRVLDADRLPDGGAPYLVMEALEGGDLSRLLAAHGPLPVADVVHYALQACEALGEAHERGIVHRDLKPSNLFVTRSDDGGPSVKVLDFGISKIDGSDADLRLTGTMMVLGSPLHMSPEQCRDAKSVDRRTDIWSLGTTLFELLAGKTPFVADNVSALVTRIVSDPPPSLRAVRPELPPALEQVLLGCLEKDVSRRHQTMAELGRALAPFAPPQAQAYAERALRGRRAGSSAPPHDAPVAARTPAPRGETDTQHSASAAPVGALTHTASVASWGATQRPRPDASKLKRRVAVLAALLLGGGATWLGATAHTPGGDISPAKPAAGIMPPASVSAAEPAAEDSVKVVPVTPAGLPAAKAAPLTSASAAPSVTPPSSASVSLRDAVIKPNVRALPARAPAAKATPSSAPRSPMFERRE